MLRFHQDNGVWLNLQRKNFMTRFLIYLFPAIVDVILAATIFVCSNRIADAGRTRTEVAMAIAAWALVYRKATVFNILMLAGYGHSIEHTVALLNV